MSSFDLTRFHGDKNKTAARGMVEKTGNDVTSFRTVIRKEADGTEYMLRTKGGSPEVTITRGVEETEVILPAGLLVVVDAEGTALSDPTVLKLERPLAAASTNPPQGVPETYTVKANEVGGVFSGGKAWWTMDEWRMVGTKAYWKKKWSKVVSLSADFIFPVMREAQRWLVTERRVYDENEVEKAAMTVPQRLFTPSAGLKDYVLLPPQVAQDHSAALLQCWDKQSFTNRPGNTDSTFYMHSEVFTFPSLTRAVYDTSCCVDFGGIANPSAWSNDDKYSLPEVYKAVVVREYHAETQGEAISWWIDPWTYITQYERHMSVQAQHFIGELQPTSIRLDSGGAGVRSRSGVQVIGRTMKNGVSKEVHFSISDAYSAPYNITQHYADSSTLHPHSAPNVIGSFNFSVCCGDAGVTTELANVDCSESAEWLMSLDCEGFAIPFFTGSGTSSAVATKYNQTKVKAGEVSMVNGAGIVESEQASNKSLGNDSITFYPPYPQCDMLITGDGITQRPPMSWLPNGNYYDTMGPYKIAEFSSWPGYQKTETISSETEYTSEMEYTATGCALVCYDADLEFAAYIECKVVFHISETSNQTTPWRWMIPDARFLGLREHTVEVNFVVQHHATQHKELLYAGSVNVQPNVSSTTYANPYYFIWAHNGVTVMNQITADGADVIWRYMVPDYRPQPSWFQTIDKVFKHQGINPIFAGYTALDGLDENTLLASHRFNLNSIPGVDWLFSWAKIDAPISSNPLETDPAKKRRYGRSPELYALFNDTVLSFEYDTSGLRLWINDIPTKPGMSSPNRTANCYRI